MRPSQRIALQVIDPRRLVPGHRNAYAPTMRIKAQRKGEGFQLADHDASVQRTVSSIPDSDRLVPGARGEPSAVRAEGHVVDKAGVVAQRAGSAATPR